MPIQSYETVLARCFKALNCLVFTGTSDTYLKSKENILTPDVHISPLSKVTHIKTMNCGFNLTNLKCFILFIIISRTVYVCVKGNNFITSLSLGPTL